MKRCSKCKCYKNRNEYRNRKELKDGLQSWCRQCENEANKRRYKPKPKKPKKKFNGDLVKRNARDRMLRHRYGITLDCYEKMYSEQNGKCAICNNKKRGSGLGGLYVDHCHKTGGVRGLLCPRCNSLLGKFLESKEILQKAVNYLEQHKNITYE